jgi:hypothetical protein
MSTLYIVRVIEDGEFFDYEYSNEKHAREHYTDEKSALLIRYEDGNHYLIASK